MIDINRFCPACGYNLRGVESDRCPECGTAFDRSLPTESAIPWVHRGKIGKWKAFWRTVKLATFTPRYFEREIERPVSLADALAFRRRVVWHAFVPIALLTGWLYLDGFELLRLPWVRDDKLGCAIEWIGLPVMLASVWLFLYFVTGVQSYVFAPKWMDVKHQNRSIALSYYAAAPWAYLLPVVAFIATGIAAANFLYANSDPPPLALAAFALVMGVPFIAQIVAICFAPHTLLRRMMHVSRGRAFVIDAGYGFGIATAAFLTIGLLNAAYWFCGLILISIR